GALAAGPMLIISLSLLQPTKVRAQNVEPSTTKDAYLLPSIPGVETFSILTTGDSVGGYRMVGIPDGLGAFKSGHGEFTLLMNHEISANPAGIVRAHGSKGAFVSRWTIDRETLEVTKGEDLTPSPNSVFLWDVSTNQYTRGTTQWQRLCSADLPAEQALFAHGRGTKARIFMDGEEVQEGRAWARIVTGPHAGEAWQLPRLGHMSFENVVASPYSQDRTVVVLTDDSNLSTAGVAANFPREGDVYIGTKTNNCRLWRLRFDDIEHPDRGGTIQILLKGDEGHSMLDNVTIDRWGRILMDEDPGNAPRVSKIWLYSIGTGELIQVVAHNPRFFDPSVPNNPDFITQDEESSGIIDASHILERGWFLLDVQAHKLSSDPELVEAGQLLALFVDPRIGASGHDPDGDHDGDDHDDDDRGDDRSGHGGDGRR